MHGGGSRQHADMCGTCLASGRMAMSCAASTRLALMPAELSAGEVKARCGTSFYKNVCYPFVKMYDPEDSHNLSIWVRCAERSPLVRVLL